VTRLTDAKLRKLNRTWQKTEPDTSIAAAFAELVERRDADLAPDDDDVEKLKAALTLTSYFLRGAALHPDLGAGGKGLLEAADALDRVLAEIP
jgi:hypothetical protein